MRTGILLVVLAWAAQKPGAAESPQKTYRLETVAGTLHTGDGGPATSALIGNIQGVAVDWAGNLYISDTDHHRVRKIDTSGVITLVAGTGIAGFVGDGGPATKASLNLPYGLAVDPAGNIYVADLGNNRVRRIAPDGTILTVAGTGRDGSGGGGGLATAAELLAPRNVALDAAGNLYISEFAGHRVRKVSPDGQISTVAGTGTAGFAGDGGPATAAQIGYPAGLAVDGHGVLYIADSQNQRIRRILPSGTIGTLLGDTPATALLTPTAIAVDASGTIYVADYSNIVRAYTPAGAWTNFAGTGDQSFAGDGGPAAAAELAAAHDLAVDTSRRLYIADGMRIRRVGPGGIIQTVAGNAHLYALGDGGDATAAPLVHPSAVALDHSGDLYLAEAGAERIRRVSASGQIATLAGTGVAGFAGDSGLAINAQVNSPAGLTVDAFGNVLVADTNNHRVRQITPGGRISTLVGTGTTGIGRDGLSGGQTPLRAPQGVCADHTGVLYVVDTANHRVLRVTPGAASVVTAAGNGSAGDDGDGGMASLAKLNRPSACAVDTAGNLFVADTLNHRIRQVTPSGAISTVAGTGVEGFAGDGQRATAALLRQPAGVAVTDDGRIFIADTGNNRIRLVTSDGVIETIAGGGDTPLNAPGGLALDGSGAAYFAETGSGLVRRLKQEVGLAAPIAELPALSIVNSISLLPGPVAPGEVVTIFGTGMGPGTGVAGAFDAAGLLANSAGGTEVRFGGVSAPVFYAQSGQVTVQVPYGVAQSAATSVEVRYNGQTAGSLIIPVATAVPALFSVATNQDGSPNSQAEPAPPNTVVTLFGTGEGLTDGANLSGQTAATPYAHPHLPVALTVAGVPAQLLFAGSAPGLVGMLQINARLPGGLALSGQATVELTVGAEVSPPIVIWLK
jgi:uncharacterized protein (TIGR03437 family)